MNTIYHTPPARLDIHSLLFSFPAIPRKKRGSNKYVFIRLGDRYRHTHRERKKENGKRNDGSKERMYVCYCFKRSIVFEFLATLH